MASVCLAHRKNKINITPGMESYPIPFTVQNERWAAEINMLGTFIPNISQFIIPQLIMSDGPYCMHNAILLCSNSIAGMLYFHYPCVPRCISQIIMYRLVVQSYCTQFYQTILFVLMFTIATR